MQKNANQRKIIKSGVFSFLFWKHCTGCKIATQRRVEMIFSSSTCNMQNISPASPSFDLTSPRYRGSSLAAQVVATGLAHLRKNALSLHSFEEQLFCPPCQANCGQGVTPYLYFVAQPNLLNVCSLC